MSRDDHIPDVFTGEMRQVDATIRFRAGTTDLLILIECRDRKKTEDVRWIEEMIEKKRGLAAAKIVLVSSTGFTEPAKAKAKLEGVELRELSAINPDTIHEWFLPHGIVHLFRLVENARCQVVLVEAGDDALDVDASEPLLAHDLVHGPFPPIVFLNFTEMTDPLRFWAVPLDGRETEMTLTIDGSAPDLIPVPLGVPKPEKAALFLLRDGAKRRVASLRITFRISYQAAKFARGDGSHHLYGPPEGEKIQHSEFQGEVFGLPVKFEHQTGDGQTSATATFPSGQKLPSTWIGLPKNNDTETKGIPSDNKS